MAYVFRNNLVGHLADLDEKIADHVLSDNQNISTEEINAALRKATI
jgi:translation elongation factor EF-G